eukprot:g3943.t1
MDRDLQHGSNGSNGGGDGGGGGGPHGPAAARLDYAALFARAKGAPLRGVFPPGARVAALHKYTGRPPPTTAGVLVAQPYAEATALAHAWGPGGGQGERLGAAPKLEDWPLAVVDPGVSALHEHGLAQYVPRLEADGVTLEHAWQLLAEDLRELGAESVMDRRRLLQLFGGAGHGPGAAPDPAPGVVVSNSAGAVTVANVVGAGAAWAPAATVRQGASSAPPCRRSARS